MRRPLRKAYALPQHIVSKRVSKRPDRHSPTSSPLANSVKCNDVRLCSVVRHRKLCTFYDQTRLTSPPLPAPAAAPPRRLELLRWCLFRFELPSVGPVLTVVLDAIKGDPEVFVSRGSLPTGSGHDHGEWESASSHEALRVLKIFPHDRK